MPDDSPARLILARAAAFRRCDFGFIFDSYLQASNFRRQFPDRDEYLRYGWANLGKDFRILDCTIVKEAVNGLHARVIFTMTIELHDERRCYAELAWLENDGDGWRYRYGQKLAGDELPHQLGELDFRHFDEAVDKVCY